MMDYRKETKFSKEGGGRKALTDKFYVRQSFILR